MSSDRKKIFQDSTQYAIVTVFGQSVSLIRAILIPILLSPIQLGVWNLMNVVVGYGGNAHLGVLHGMNKIIPLLRGQGALAEVEEIKDSTFWVNMFLGAGWFVFIWVCSYAVRSGYSNALRITAFTILMLSIYGYYFSLLRADNRFKLVSVGVGGLSILSTIFVLGLSWFCKDRLVGALLGLVAAYGLVVIFWVLKSRYHFIFHISSDAVRRSFGMGVPLIILGVFDSIFLSVDRWVIAASMGATMLGYYALGIMSSNLIGLVPSSIASVLYPKMLERFGANGNPTALKSLFVGPTRLMAGFVSLLIGGAMIILPFLIKFILPKFLPSVSLFIILLPAAFFYAAASIPGSFMVSINKQRLLIVIQIVAISFALMLDFVVVKMRWGIVGIACSTAFAYAVYGGGYIITAAHFAFKRRADIVHFLVEIYGVFAAMLLGLILTMSFIPEGADMGIAVVFTAVRLVCFLAVLLPVIWWSNRQTGLLAIAREMFPAYFNRSKGDQGND